MRIALAGNPNSGKTTLFNLLTGSTAHVGNWPGVTIDKKVGKYKNKEDNLKIDIVDLPGIYSLSPYTPEEIIARNYIIDEKPDVIINIVDATNLERNLYLSTQLIELGVPIVIALNMIDIVEKRRGSIDVEAIAKKMGVAVVKISALRNKGIKELMSKVNQVSKEKVKERSLLEEFDCYNLVLKVKELLDQKKIKNSLFHSIKLLENDELEMSSHKELKETLDTLRNNYKDKLFGDDFEAVIADARYKFINNNLSKYIIKGKSSENVKFSDKIDKVLTNKIFGLPIFALIMLFVFHFTFSEDLFFIKSLWKSGIKVGDELVGIPSLGFFLQSLFGDGIEGLYPGLMSTLSELAKKGLESQAPWVSGLVVDAIIGGVGAVISFIPQIMILYFFLSLLEDSGYMARVSFILDKLLRRFGITGKAFMPLIMCFGCAVPGIFATRTLENAKEKRLTIMLTPFFSCGAKLPIWSVFSIILLRKTSIPAPELIVFSMYLIGIAVAIISAIILKRTLFKGQTPPFILELPEYRMPKFKNTMVFLWDKMKHYIYKAATIIAAATIVIWFLSNFNWEYKMVDSINNSILADIGKGIRWIFVPLGFGMNPSKSPAKGWMFVVAAFTGLLAKEVVISTLGMFSSSISGEEIGDDFDGEEAASDSKSAFAILLGSLSAPALFAFMVFNLLTIPCLAAVAAARSELNNKKHLRFAILFWFLASYIITLYVYWVGTLKWLQILSIVILVILVIIGIVILIRKKKLFNKIRRNKK